MASEISLIMKRRFFGRILESGLLIIAVALGVGAAASGLSLMFHTREYSSNLLNAAEYKEIVVTTRANIEDMTYPVVEKAPNTTRLTTKDLEAGQLIDEIYFSYVVEQSRIRLVTDETSSRTFPGAPTDQGAPTGQSTPTGSEAPQGMPPEGQVPPPGEMPPEGMGDFSQMIESYKELKDNPDYIITEKEEIQGVTVTQEFFDAWNIDTIEGSLFSLEDYTGTDKFILVGSELEKALGSNGESIIGKKIISMDGIYTIIGVLEETGTKYDDYYISPKKDSGNTSFMGRFGNSQLRFYVDDVNLLDSTAERLKEWFTSQYGEGQVEVSNPREAALRVLNRNNGISILILFLSLAGLFIASVNVSNILMSRSIRMKKHVGILKALGGSKKSILMLFVKEALVITLAGSILGTLLAIPLSITMEKSLGLGDVSWVYIIAGVCLSSILTLIFSVFPAKQSMNIEASEAMRTAG